VNRRRLVLTDVTAMAADAVCIAGIDVSTAATVRLNDPQPTLALLRQVRALSVGAAVEATCEPVRHLQPPHVEDMRWRPDHVRPLPPLPFDELLALNTRVHVQRLEDAFGPPSHRGANENHAWPPGIGERSLAAIRVRWVRMETIEGRPRVALMDASGAYYRGIPFQDLAARAHRDTCESCHAGWFGNVMREFSGDDCIVRVGLTRPFGTPEVCWLQVTNVLARPRRHFL